MAAAGGGGRQMAPLTMIPLEPLWLSGLFFLYWLVFVHSCFQSDTLFLEGVLVFTFVLLWVPVTLLYGALLLSIYVTFPYTKVREGEKGWHQVGGLHSHDLGIFITAVSYF